jgi:hypothetical protein
MTKRGGKYINPDLREGIKQPGHGADWASGAPASPKSLPNNTRSGAMDMPAIRSRA